jgi:hypothetical protein
MKKLFVIAAIGALSSCSSIINGSKQIVTIESNVKGADININGSSIGTTPYTGPIKRSGTTVVRVAKTGYSSKTITMSADIEPIFWGNIIVGGVFGSSTDYGTGAMYKYAPATIQVDLEREGK